MTLTDVPPARAFVLFTTQWPVAGDWDGDGVDGVGIYVAGTGTFHWRNEPTTGPADVALALDAADGWPRAAIPLVYPIAGDFNGDGTADVGVFDGSSAYLRTNLTAGPPHLTWTTGC